ncbi:MAG: hypothetical protein CVU97_03070 [Firmicutes bacterium HGW-Firmicutes-21]|nr:MAG: hypothetical protein CVU97_03070 [Firmicutes bacterium HGW-Firmicutes-21]
MNQKSPIIITAPKTKTKSEKIGLIIIFSIGALLLALILYLYGVFAFIGIRLYSGDRIKGEIFVEVNNKEFNPSSVTAYFNDRDEVSAALDDNSLYIVPYNKKNKKSSVVSDSRLRAKYIGSSFSATGGEEGLYTLDFAFDKDELYAFTDNEIFSDMKDDLHIAIKYSNKKWYYITTIELSVFITASENGIICEIIAEYYADKAVRYNPSVNVSRTFYLDNLSENNKIEFIICD